MKTSVFPINWLIVSLFSLHFFSFKGNEYFEFKGQSKDRKYGVTENKPIQVGGGNSLANQNYFLSILTGLNREDIVVKGLGFCGQNKKLTQE